MKNVILAFFIIIFFRNPASSEMNSSNLRISKEICNKLHIDHIPSPDVAYQPGVDVQNNPVQPADLGVQIKIDLPDTYYIPVQIKIKRYLRTQNYKDFSDFQLNTEKIEYDRILYSTEKSIKEIQYHNKELAIAQRFSLNIKKNKVQKILTRIGTLSPLIEKASQTLESDFQTLQKQFESVTQEPLSPSKNIFLQPAQQEKIINQYSITSNLSKQIQTTQFELDQTRQLLYQNPEAIQYISELQVSFEKAQKKISPLVKSYKNFTNKIRSYYQSYVEDVFLGHIIVHKDGRLYFNEQPLFQEDEWQIKEACRRLYLREKS